MRLISGVRCQSSCSAAIRRHLPKVSFRREDDGVVVDGRKPVITPVGSLGGESGGKEKQKHERSGGGAHC